jgi:hypothetical protein
VIKRVQADGLRPANTSTTAMGLAGMQPAQQLGSAVSRKWSALLDGSRMAGQPAISTALPSAQSAQGVPRSLQ